MGLLVFVTAEFLVMILAKGAGEAAQLPLDHPELGHHQPPLR